MAKEAKALTKARHKTHGLFEDVAAASEGLLVIMQGTKNWAKLSTARREAIKMITHKLARIGAGDFEHSDHWDDIGGYALLGKQDGQNAKPKARAPRAAKADLKKAKPPKARAVSKPPAKKRVAKKSSRSASNTPMGARPAPARQRRPRPAAVNEAPAQTAEA